MSFQHQNWLMMIFLFHCNQVFWQPIRTTHPTPTPNQLHHRGPVRPRSNLIGGLREGTHHAKHLQDATGGWGRFLVTGRSSPIAKYLKGTPKAIDVLR